MSGYDPKVALRRRNIAVRGRILRLAAGIAEREGREAFRFGQPASANPYQTEGKIVEAHAWARGWNAARANYTVT